MDPVAAAIQYGHEATKGAVVEILVHVPPHIGAKEDG